MNKSGEFDFIIGKWTVKNRKLKERLCGCNEWIEFTADFESRRILNGLGNMDEMMLESENMNFCGLSIRMYNPESKTWTIYWADNHHPEIGLKKQVVGKFDNKKGTFYGEELYNTKLMKLRFIWESITEDHARWEQAYFDEQKNEWETNWTMDFWKKT